MRLADKKQVGESHPVLFAVTSEKGLPVAHVKLKFRANPMFFSPFILLEWSRITKTTVNHCHLVPHRVLFGALLSGLLLLVRLCCSVAICGPSSRQAMVWWISQHARPTLHCCCHRFWKLVRNGGDDVFESMSNTFNLNVVCFVYNGGTCQNRKIAYAFWVHTELKLKNLSQIPSIPLYPGAILIT